MADVRGQGEARRALEIAAAGGAQPAAGGPPGTGKSMLAKRLPGILPPLTYDEALETSAIYSVAGLLRGGLVKTRPFRSPHHSVSSTALAGGGTVPRPRRDQFGAQRRAVFGRAAGIFARYAGGAAPAAGGWCRDGERVHGTATYPCKFMLVAAMNPCKCGYLGHPTRECTCTPSAIEQYRRRISGPLLDRIDLHVEALPVEYEDLAPNRAASPAPPCAPAWWRRAHCSGSATTPCPACAATPSCPAARCGSSAA